MWEPPPPEMYVQHHVLELQRGMTKDDREKVETKREECRQVVQKGLQQWNSPNFTAVMEAAKDMESLLTGPYQTIGDFTTYGKEDEWKIAVQKCQKAKLALQQTKRRT